MQKTSSHILVFLCLFFSIPCNAVATEQKKQSLYARATVSVKKHFTRKKTLMAAGVTTAILIPLIFFKYKRVRSFGDTTSNKINRPASTPENEQVILQQAQEVLQIADERTRHKDEMNKLEAELNIFYNQLGSGAKLRKNQLKILNDIENKILLEQEKFNQKREHFNQEFYDDFSKKFDELKSDALTFKLNLTRHFLDKYTPNNNSSNAKKVRDK